MSGPDDNEEPDLSGTVLGRYRLVRRLGLGGMGAVYLAQHELLDRQAAVKVLNEALSAKEIARKRFLREARAASKVKHAGVVEIFDVAFAGSHVYFVMELLRGRDLSERLKAEGRMSWADAQPILLEVAEAIAAAHEVGVIHRDIKPSNCFLVADAQGRDGRLKMVDFGIAKVVVGDLSATQDLTTTGEVFGTVGYMPPEMAQGVHDEPRSDLYELGVMMFRMLTGRLPFIGTPVQVIAQHIGKPAPSPRSMEPSIPASVERIILRALEKEPADREPSMRHMAAALKAAAPSGAPRSATPAKAEGQASGPPVNPRTSTLKDRSGPHERPPAATAPVPPPMPASESDMIGLDERPEAPSRSGGGPNDPWNQDHARTTAYGEEPELPPMPGEPDLPPERFRPPPEADLELVLDDTRPKEPSPQPSPSMPPWLLRALVIAVIVGVSGYALWSYRDSISEAAPESLDELQHEVGLSPDADADADVDAEPVLLLIDTVPKDARIYIDDERRSERPISVPRSKDYLRVRVEADGYETRSIQVQPLRTRQLEVKLDRSKKRKKGR